MQRPSQKELEIALKVLEYFRLSQYKFTDWDYDSWVEIEFKNKGRHWFLEKDMYKVIKDFEDNNKLPQSESVKKIKKVIREEIKNVLSEQKWEDIWKKAKLTDEERMILVHTFDTFAHAAPSPNERTYIYINPKYAKKIISNALKEKHFSDKGESVAKSLLSKLEKAGVKET